MVHHIIHEIKVKLELRRQPKSACVRYLIYTWSSPGHLFNEPTWAEPTTPPMHFQPLIIKYLTNTTSAFLETNDTHPTLLCEFQTFMHPNNTRRGNLATELQPSSHY